MVFHKNKLSVLVLLFVLLSFGSLAQPFAGAMIIQGEKRVPLGDEQSIKLKREPFTLRFHSPRYSEDAGNALQLAAFEDKGLPDKARVGMAVSRVPYLAPGSGMAADADTGYSEMILNPEGHHYLYYFDERDHRAALAGQQGDWLTLDWSVNALLIAGKRKTLKESGVHTLYLVLFFDANHNQRIDAGELNKVTLTFD
ncbi:hypothetical protein [Taibaiella koreensis]|uniref:hypothetical protein n=1 Tax=Taibaiella koreensis TaxID=1268548 RepID=UPI0013C2F208|nr:hypothetical protein [Taibaiella koreensis]